MRLTNQRILYSDNGVIEDVSGALNNYREGSKAFTWVGAEDALYIGSDLPFNNRYWAVSTPDATAATVSVSIWDGNTGWIPALDIIAPASPMGAAGYIRFTPDKDEQSWNTEDESHDIPALVSGPQIYCMYWARVTFSADLTFTLDFLGHRFSDTEALYTAHPDLNNSVMLDRWETGKTNWDEQCFMAAEEIIDDLRAGGIALSPSQVLDYERFRRASIHKTAEIIYRGFQDPFESQRAAAAKRYSEAFNAGPMNLDLNGSARLEGFEATADVTIVSR